MVLLYISVWIGYLPWPQNVGHSVGQKVGPKLIIEDKKTLF